MYNEKQKTKFIRDYTVSISAASVYEKIFNTIETYEYGWGGDICTRGAEDLQMVVDNIAGVRAKSKLSQVIMLREYIKWCVANNIPNAINEMSNVHIEGTSRIKEYTVANPVHLQKYLDALYTSEDKETTDNIYRCFFWLAYSGMKEEDILNLSVKDVDLSNMIVNYNGDDYPIYTQSIKAIRNCITLSQFAYEHPSYNSIIYKDRTPGDLIMRGIKGVPNIKSLRVSFSRKIKEKVETGETNIQLSYYRAWLSGVFYRMHEREKAGYPIDFYAFVIYISKEKKYNLSSGRNTIDAKMRQLAKEYSADYLRWKVAYEL